MAHAPKKSGKTAKGHSNRSSWGGWFVRCIIPDEHFELLDKIPVDFARLAEWEAQMVSSGFKLSFSQKADSGSFVASLTCTDSESPVFQGTLSSFGGTYWEAKIALWWKHEEILAGQWKNDTDRDTKYG